MKKYSIYFMMMLFVSALIFTGCKDDDDDDVVADPAFTILKDYLVASDMDLNKILTNADGEKFVVPAPATVDEVADFLASYYIMDIRSATDYAAGHLEGAVNVAFADILTEAANADKKIMMVCYTGQTACYATSLLRLYGYPSTRSLKWGMSGWNADYSAKWDNSIGNIAENNSNWTYDAAPTPMVYSIPEFTSTSEDGATILKERVEYVVTYSSQNGGLQGVNGSDVLANPGNYYINNYFNETDYSGFGHITGADRINPLILGDDSHLALDPDAEVVTYCYTGQTSAVITAFLRVVGYDAYSLKFGVNGMYNSHSQWSSNQWGGDSNPKDYPTVQ